MALDITYLWKAEMGEVSGTDGHFLGEVNVETHGGVVVREGACEWKEGCRFEDPRQTLEGPACNCEI